MDAQRKNEIVMGIWEDTMDFNTSMQRMGYPELAERCAAAYFAEELHQAYACDYLCDRLERIEITAEDMAAFKAEVKAAQDRKSKL